MSHNPAFDLACSRCPATAVPLRVGLDGPAIAPPGWSHVTMTGLPVRNWLLCPSCTSTVHAVLDQPPARVPILDAISHTEIGTTVIGDEAAAQ